VLILENADQVLNDSLC